MTITPQYFTPRPLVTGVFQLTAENVADAVDLLLGVFPNCQAATTETGIQWHDVSFGGSTMTAAYGDYVHYTASGQPVAGYRIQSLGGSNMADDLGNQAAPAPGSLFTLTS